MGKQLELDFKPHPIVEGLIVNEDGSIVKHLDRVIPQTPINKGDTYIMKVKGKNVTRQKLVLEAWVSLADTPELIAVKIDSEKGTHYTNLKWSKRGQGVAHKRAKTFGGGTKAFKFPTKESFDDFVKSKPEGITMKKYLIEKNISEFAFYQAKKRYG